MIQLESMCVTIGQQVRQVPIGTLWNHTPPLARSTGAAPMSVLHGIGGVAVKARHG